MTPRSVSVVPVPDPFFVLANKNLAPGRSVFATNFKKKQPEPVPRLNSEPKELPKFPPRPSNSLIV